MNKKIFIRTICLILIAFIVFGFAYETFAIQRAVSPWSSVNQFDTKTANARLKNVVRTPLGFVLSLVRTVAVIIAICMLLWSAIRYMAPNFTLFGSALDKAEVKRDIPRFVVGSLLLFGSSGFLTFILYIIEDVVG